MLSGLSWYAVRFAVTCSVLGEGVLQSASSGMICCFGVSTVLWLALHMQLLGAEVGGKRVATHMVSALEGFVRARAPWTPLYAAGNTPAGAMVTLECFV